MVSTASQTLQKGLDILFLMAQSTSPLTIGEIGEKLDTPSSTVYRIIGTLKENGLVERIDREGHLILGMRTLTLTRSLNEQNILIKVARPEMRRLRDRTNESIHLYAISGTSQICLESAESFAPLRVMSTKGEARPLYAGASGKVLLAFLGEEERMNLLSSMEITKVTPNTITDRAKLQKDLEKIRKRGYSHTRSEILDGAEGVAVPIFNGKNQIVASLSLAGPVQRMKKANIKDMISMVKDAGEKISSSLKYS